MGVCVYLNSSMALSRYLLCFGMSCLISGCCFGLVKSVSQLSSWMRLGRLMAVRNVLMVVIWWCWVGTLNGGDGVWMSFLNEVLIDIFNF